MYQKEDCDITQEKRDGFVLPVLHVSILAHACAQNSPSCQPFCKCMQSLCLFHSYDDPDPPKENQEDELLLFSCDDDDDDDELVVLL